MGKEPVQPQDKYVIRMPDGMRERLKSAADKHKRSMNAEIVARLESSLNFERLAAQVLDAKDREIAELQALIAEGFSPKNVLFVALDAEGKPLSWDEVWANLGGLMRAADLNFDSMQARIFDSVPVQNSKREEQWQKVLEFYRKKQKRKMR